MTPFAPPLLKTTGLPLEVLPDGDFPAVEVAPLESGELLLLFTDGMVEADGPDDRLFGLNRLLEVVRTHQSQPARAIVDTLYSAVRAYCGAQAQLDDITVIIIKATPAGVMAAA